MRKRFSARCCAIVCLPEVDASTLSRWSGRACAGGTLSSIVPGDQGVRHSGPVGGSRWRGTGIMGRVDVSPRVRHAKRLFAELGPTYERTGAMLSFGQDPRWRRFIVSRVRVPRGGLALDVAAGTGLVARELVRRNPSATVIALDQSAPMLREGRRRTAGMVGAERVRFVLADGQHLAFGDATFDALPFTYLLRYV